MGVLEMTLLRLKPSTKYTDPLLLQNLRSIRAQLQTNSRFYIDVDDNSKLYIMGLWPTMEAHKTFLASPDRARILGPQEGQTEFVWGIHIDGISSMDELPLKAEVMYVSRIVSPKDGVDGTERWLQVETNRLKQKHPQAPVLCKERLDLAPGDRESVLVFGSNNSGEIYSVSAALPIAWSASGSLQEWRATDLEREAGILENQ